MLKGRGKGKVSHDLVAASCAAVLAVYAAGYLRTRDAARRLETPAKERRSAARPEPMAAISLQPVPIEMSAPAPLSAPPQPSAPKRAHTRTVGAKTALVRPPPPPVAAPDAAPATATVPAIAPVPLPAAEANPAIPLPITREPAAAAPVKWRDGTYTGLGESAHGDIEARVVIRDGRIVEAGISNCDTRYPCDVIAPLIHQPVERQSPDVDYMSHATESSDAYYDALVAALDNAREPSSGAAPLPK